MKTTIKQLGIFLLFAVFSTTGLTAQNSNLWMLDKDHTSVNFDVQHFFSTVNGNFTEFDGEFQFDPDNLKASKFIFTVPVSSIETNNQKRNNHLKSDDFFSAAKYPNIKFQSTGFQKMSAKDYVVTGDLTIKDVTKRVAIPFEITGKMEHPMMKGTTILGLAFNTSLDRTDYEVGTGDWASDMVVGDNVNIAVNMELNQKQ